MSSNEEDYNDNDNASNSQMKKRRIQRACDICRRKKIRCDGVQMPGNRCSNCIAYSFECTYIEAAKKRGPPKGYVESLENRVEKLEKLLHRICPDEDLLKDLDNNVDRDSWLAEKLATISRTFSSGVVRHNPVNTRDAATSAIRQLSDVQKPLRLEEVDPDDDFAHVMLADNLKKLDLRPGGYRFFGKSSGAMLIQTAIELKHEYTGTGDQAKHNNWGGKRPEFWSIRPWEQAAAQLPHTPYEFPEHGLLETLINLYFENINIFYPLLHRPTFDKNIEDGLHLTHEMFGATLLLVCAVGSRYTEDVRVRLDGVETLHSNGWKYFDQVQIVKKSLLDPPSVYDLQFYCLSVQYLQGSSAPQACWTMVGIGIRLAQDVGAHRRKTHRGENTVESELWKRAFWVLVIMDRMVSSALGRPCAIQDEDFDLELPLECDDEYWDAPNPDDRFKQPSDKPSRVTAFNLFLKLNQVLSFSLRTIYSINKSKILLGFVGPQWEQHIVAELDSALNKWVDSVPDFLRWDPSRENELFFNQSVLLYTCYYNIQILIHRPFIPSPRKPSPLSFPSLAICTNAARSCSHIVDIQRRRSKTLMPHLQMSAFTAGIVLLLNIWGGKRSGLSTDPTKEIADVHKCMSVLRCLEQRWHACGRLWDVLYELASVGELPLPQPSPPSTNKRERDSDSPVSATTEGCTPPSCSDGPRPLAGSKRVMGKEAVPSITKPSSWQAKEPRHAHPPPATSRTGTLSQAGQHLPRISTTNEPSNRSSQLFTLPIYSDELGSIPLHGQVQFSSTGQSPLNIPPEAYWYGGASGSLGVSADSRVSPAASTPVSSTSPVVTGSPSGSLAVGVDESPISGSRGYPGDLSVMASTFGVMEGVYATGGGQDQQMGMAAAFGMPFTQGQIQSSSTGGPGPVRTSRLGGGHPQHPAQMHPPHHPGHPHQQLQQQQQLYGYGGSGRVMPPPQSYVDNGTMVMWSNAPTGFELDDWGTYLTNVSELTQALGGQGRVSNPQ